MMDWRKVWVVTRHEYLTNVRRVGFIIMTASVPVLGIVVVAVRNILCRSGPPARRVP